MTAILVRGAARVAVDGKVVQLGSRPQPDEVVTEQDVQDPKKLARVLVRILATVSEVRRTFIPRRTDFEDVPVGGAGGNVSFEHGFNGRVRWWIVGWTSTNSFAPILRENTAATTSSTLVLASFTAGTATIRVEEAG